MLSLKATIRTQLGKKSKKLRRDGYIPAILYGRKIESLPISLGYKEFERVYKEAGGSTLISLEIDQNSDTKKDASEENIVLIRDAIIHPLARTFMHVDFYQVPMNEEITVSVPLTFENEAPAVKSEGAVLVRNVYEIEVSALPKNLPPEILVDLSSLKNIDDAILVKDLLVPEGVHIGAEEDIVIAQTSAPRKEEIAEEAPEEVAAEDIKTEAEGKREEAKEETETIESRE